MKQLVLVIMLFAISGFAQTPTVTPIPASEIRSRFAPFVGVWNVISCPDDPKKKSSSVYQLELSLKGTTIEINEPYYLSNNGLVYHPVHPYVLIEFAQLTNSDVTFDNLYFKEGGEVPANTPPWRMSLAPYKPGLFGRFAERGENENTSTLFGYYVGAASVPMPDDFIKTHKSVCEKE